MKILSIDDSKAVHAYLTDCFNETDHVLEHAYLGAEGIQMAKQLHNHPQGLDLILLDWEMPGMTGPEVFQALRTDQINIPIIMLTSKNEVRDITDMLTKGASEYIMKPFTPEILFEKIEAVTGILVKKNDT